MYFLLGGLIALLVLWAGSWQFWPRDFALMIMVGLILRVHSAIVKHETLKALTQDAKNAGPIRDTLKRCA
jgi:uncharacterized membrane protein